MIFSRKFLALAIVTIGSIGGAGLAWASESVEGSRASGAGSLIAMPDADFAQDFGGAAGEEAPYLSSEREVRAEPFTEMLALNAKQALSPIISAASDSAMPVGK